MSASYQTQYFPSLRNYVSSYRESFVESVKTKEISAILKAQLFFGLEYVAMSLFSSYLNNFSHKLYFVMSWHAFIKFHLRTLSLVIFSSSYLAPYEQDGEMIPRPSTEKTPLTHLLILNLTQPVLLKILRASCNLLIPYLFTQNLITQALSFSFSFSTLALMQGFFLWQYSFTRDGYTPEQSVKILSQNGLQNMVLGLLPALIQTVSAAYFYTPLATGISSFFALFFISHALKQSLSEMKFNCDIHSPFASHSPFWRTWHFHLWAIQKMEGNKPNPTRGHDLGLKIRKLRNSFYYQQFLSCLNKLILPFLSFCNQSFLYSQELLTPLFQSLTSFSSLQPIFPASLSFLVFPSAVIFIGTDLSKTLSRIHQGLHTYSGSIQYTQSFMGNRFLSPFIRQISLFTLGNTWTQIATAVGVGLELSSIQDFLTYLIQQLPKASGLDIARKPEQIETNIHPTAALMTPPQLRENYFGTSSLVIADPETLRRKIQAAMGTTLGT